MKKIVAIHQPNFFPWLGYFDKISKADIFVVMDNVEFPRTSRGTWCNRVKIMVSGKANWVTMPVVRTYHGLRIIRDMQIDNSGSWRKKLLKTIRLNYSRCKFFKETFSFVESLIINPTSKLSDYNLTTIRAFMVALGLDASKLILGSSLNAKGKGTDLLVSMLKAVGGQVYLCGGGSAGYLEDEKFPEAGIKLRYQNFKHPVYKQFGREDFEPGLSIIDSFFNVGIEETKKLLGINYA